MQNRFVFLIGFLWISTALFAQETEAWKPIQKRQAKADKVVAKYLNRDTLMKLSDAHVYFRWADNSEKPYLILIHGMGLNGSTMWQQQVKILSENYQLIIPDLVGYGKSTFVKTDFSPEFQADLIIESISRVGITKPIHVLGFSYGGLVAACLQQRHPNRVNKLIICDSPVKFFSNELADSMARNAKVDSIQQLIVPQTSRDVDGLIFAMSSKKVNLPPKLKEKVRKHLFASNAETKYGQMSHLRNNEYHYRAMNYKLVGAKTTFLWGELDGVIPPIVGQKLKELYPESTLVIFPNGKHDIHIMDVKKFANEVNLAIGR